MHYIRPAMQEDVGYLSNNLREEDVEEVCASNSTPLSALSHGFEMSDPCLTLTDKQDVPIAMLGTVPFLRNSKPVLSDLFDRTGCSFFYNYTYVSNALHHRWLRWLGFTFLRTITMPTTGKEFIEFVKLRG